MSDYQSIFSDKTFKTLSKKSAESLKKMLKGKSFMQAAQGLGGTLNKLMEIEAPYKDYLEDIAKEVVYKAFPIVQKAGIEIEVYLGKEKMDFKLGKDEESIKNNPQASQQFSQELEKEGINKRRLINAITQGAAIRGTKAYYLFRDVIEVLDPKLLDEYNDFMDDVYGIYDDDNAIAMFMAMISQNLSQQMEGGESEAEWDEDEGKLVIKAQGLVFPILIHEIIKGLYEIVSLQGFSSDKEKNKQIVQKVDKVQNEPEDLRYGKFIYDAINNLFINSGYSTNTSIRELFFAEIYKLSDKDFYNFIENSINDELTSSQKNWVNNTLKKLNDENEQEEDI